MRTEILAFAGFLIAAIGSAQSPVSGGSGRVFDLTNKPNPQGLQEIATILRTVGDIRDLSLDAAASTVTVQGSTDQLALAGWLIRTLDAGTPPSPPEYQIPGDNVVKVFYLSRSATPLQVQEILTILRTVAGVQKVFNYSAQNAIVLRCDAGKMTLVEKLFSDMGKR